MLNRVVSDAPFRASDVLAPTANGVGAWLEYQRDVIERSVLFLDTLRRRGNAMLEHERAGFPPLLDFKYEMVLDARAFEHPANYALVKILEAGNACWSDCVDPNKPPVIIIDPRAGHGPGIGGFKSDSEVGMALHLGHPVYFVIFYPEPCPGQTLEHVLDALKAFVQHVGQCHAPCLPILYGNCQAGWAAVLTAAHCSSAAGPVVLNGSPLSYWAGEPGVNPMRVAGGFVGGTWLTHLLGDLGNGRFDGAWLAQNFEGLKPETAIVEKYAHLFTHIDTEQKRFLDFERWWNGFHALGTEEIVSIVENLFIGNRLEEGKVRVDAHCTADLASITSPLVIFASFGDNITPPHQALAWISAVYGTTERLVAAKQRIVYLTNAHVGHLGIFVSGTVAKFEHRAILEHLPSIAELDPDLYEMKIENPTGDPNCKSDQYSVRFERRRVEDLHFDYPKTAFEIVRRISEQNEAFYRTFVSPWVRAIANPFTALGLSWLHPMRMRTVIFCEGFAPAMALVAQAADAIRKSRHTLTDTHPYIQAERDAFDNLVRGTELVRHARDAFIELAFQAAYGWPWGTNAAAAKP